jgi:Restriction endonuclease
MPRRTNDFQQLIHLIYQQMAPVGATVLESALISERHSSTQREVDILIEHTMVGVPMRIAVECRDRTRKSDVEWIDSLIGKFRDLPIHTVIAVSKSGFTSAAVDKAAANHIETRTLEQALHTNWPGQFLRPELWKIVRYTDILRVYIEAAPPLTKKPHPDDIIVDDSGEVCGSFMEAMKYCHIQTIEPAIKEFTDQYGLELFSNPENRSEPLLFDIRAIAHNIYLKQEDVLYRIVSLIFQTTSRFSFVPVELQDYVYQDIQVSTGRTTLDELGLEVEITAMQRQGEDEIKVFTKSTEFKQQS